MPRHRGAAFHACGAEKGATVLPVDSEHNAVFQALCCGKREAVSKVTLTASGGPFRTMSRERLAFVTPEEAVRHPNWSMGAKISINSATLMNKGLELIEAAHLFDLAPSQFDVLIHPQSVVHALVEFHDGSVVAQMAHPDMRIPIGFCLAWPERLEWNAPKLDLAKVGALHFEAPDDERFPALRLARAALKTGGSAPECFERGERDCDRRLPAAAALVSGHTGACGSGSGEGSQRRAAFRAEYG